MSSIDRIVLAEVVGEELSKLNRDDLLDVSKEVRQVLSFCLSRLLSCAKFIELVHDVVKSLHQIRFSKVISDLVPSAAREESFIDLNFLREIARELYTYYLVLLFGLSDEELRIPVKFEEDVVIGERRYRAFSSKLIRVSEALALLRSRAKIRMLVPRALVEYSNTLLSETK
ncbi:MAG: hypothetical protein RMH84_05445 [Sulfolobales archaeon]|nr:hypothetical protein [Sulfolobales archaeon]MDW8011020.1 hypothetical protein [Sulfolobales archaeon]